MPILHREGVDPSIAWNELIRQINALAETCEGVDSLPEAAAWHIITRQDIQDAQDKLIEVCEDNEFDPIPNILKKTTIDALVAALDAGACSCEGCDTDAVLQYPQSGPQLIGFGYIIWNPEFLGPPVAPEDGGYTGYDLWFIRAGIQPVPEGNPADDGWIFVRSGSLDGERKPINPNPIWYPAWTTEADGITVSEVMRTTDPTPGSEFELIPGAPTPFANTDPSEIMDPDTKDMIFVQAGGDTCTLMLRFTCLGS